MAVLREARIVVRSRSRLSDAALQQAKIEGTLYAH
jgi:hypothetical protein